MFIQIISVAEDFQALDALVLISMSSKEEESNINITSVFHYLYEYI